MRLIGVGELLVRANQALRRMRQVNAKAGKQCIPQGWESYARLAEQLRQEWPVEPGTHELLDEIRQ